MTDPQLVEFSGSFAIDFYGFWIKNVMFAEMYNIKLEGNVDTKVVAKTQCKLLRFSASFECPDC